MAACSSDFNSKPRSHRQSRLDWFHRMKMNLGQTRSSRPNPGFVIIINIVVPAIQQIEDLG